VLTLTAILAVAAILFQPGDTLAVSGVVVDPAGKPVADAEVVFAGRVPADGSYPTLAQTKTDDHGSFRLEIDQNRLTGMDPVRFLWAYRTGLTVAVQRLALPRTGALPSVRLTLAEPLKRAISLVDSEGKPAAGARVAPVLHACGVMSIAATPEDRLERMTVVSGADGVALVPYLPSTIDPLTLRVTAPGMASHDLPLPYRPGSDRFTLKIGRPARAAGSVYYDSGQPAANVTVEVWVQNPFYLPTADATDSKTPGLPSLIKFDSGPVRTAADGSFSTPKQLMTGSSYRIVVRSDRESFFASDWLPASTELVNVPAVRLRLERKLVGLVKDRQGAPVRDARVFLPSGIPSTATDEKGHFSLEGALPDKTYLLVQAEGFRLRGWPVVPVRQPQERTYVLVRSSEPPDRVMAPLPPPISVDEARALARRALEPFLQAALTKGDDNARRNWLRQLVSIDPARALRLLEAQHLRMPGADASLRSRIAVQLLPTDPIEAESLVGAIADARERAAGYQSLAAALPAAERARKRAFLDHAAVAVLAPAEPGKAPDPRVRLNQLGRLAGAWLNFGELEKARPLVEQGLKELAALPPAQRDASSLLSAAARLQPDRVLALVRDLSGSRRLLCCSAIAEALVDQRSNQAEHAIELIEPPPNIASDPRWTLSLRLCWSVAKTDSERAKRAIARLGTPRLQACGWALVALALADQDQPAARSALAESIQLIERVDGPPGAAEPIRFSILAFNPAAAILPIVEKVAPERVEEVFWKAFSLMPKADAAGRPGVVFVNRADPAVVLARYDREVADVFLARAVPASSAAQRDPRDVVDVIETKAVIDPRAAVDMLEALPPLNDSRDGRASRSRDFACQRLIECLLESNDDHWQYFWRSEGIPLGGRQ
jgi:hypothetical protein